MKHEQVNSLILEVTKLSYFETFNGYLQCTNVWGDKMKRLETAAMWGNLAF